MNQTKYIAFISYRHQTPDQEIAKALHTAIETYGIPASVKKKTGIRKMGKVFRDQEELPLSSDLGADIETALDNSDWLIVICSSIYQESRWCMRELEYFIEKKGKDRVLTILTEGEPKDSFPEVLQFREDEQGQRQSVEPLAADVRGETLAESLKKLRKEKLRLLAPILGVTYDELYLRERQRLRKRIAAAVAAVLILGGTLTGILLRNAALQREAEEQQRIAEEERLKAIDNSIGESLQRANVFRENNDRRQSAELLLDALALSEGNDDLRREEIISQLRRTMYIEPFTVVSKLDLQNARLNNAQISPDGTKALCIANGNTAALFDLKTSRLLYAVSMGKEQLDAVAFSPDGSRFVGLYGYYHWATVWNTEDGSEVYTYTSRTDEEGKVANARFWKGSDTLLIQDHDQLFLVSIPDGETTLFYTIGEQQEGYNYDNTLYTFGTGKAIDEIITDYVERYTGCPLIISQDGTKVMIAGLVGETGTIVLNDQGQRISLLDRMPGVMFDFYGMSPDGRYVACQARAFGFLGVWETETGKLRYLKTLDRGVTNGASVPVFSPDSQKLAFISENTLVILSAEKGKELVRKEIEWTDPVPPALSWSKDGSFLFFYTPNLYFVDAETGEAILFVASDVDNMYNNAMPAGDDYVFVTRGGGEAVLYSQPGISSVVFTDSRDEVLTGYDPRREAEAPWDKEPEGEHQVTETFKALNELEGYDPKIYFSREGEYAALIYPDGTIEVFRKGGSGQVDLLNAQFVYEPAAFGIAGDTMVASDRVGRMLFQNLQNGEMIILNSGMAHITFVFSGNLLMAAREDRLAIDIYDIEKAELLFSMNSSVPFTGMGFSEDGNYAVAVTEEDERMAANLWLDESALLEQARRFAPGN